MHPEWLNLVRVFLLPGCLAQRTNLRVNFLSAEVSRTVRDGSADLQNGSERFCRPPERFGTVLQTLSLHGDISPQLPNPPKTVKSSSSYFVFSKPSKEPPWAPRTKVTRARCQKNDKGKAISPPICKSLNRQCKGMLSTKEKVELDVDYNRLEVLSCLFMEGVAPFKILPVLKIVLWNLF